MKFKIFLVSFFIFITSCKDYYNETISWIDNIKIGTNIETVRKSQPRFIDISWEKPLIIDNKKLYEIIEIKGNNDFLNMSNFLVFIDDKYQGRESIK